MALSPKQTPPQKPRANLWFVGGREPEISLAELVSVLSLNKESYTDVGHGIIKTQEDLVQSPNELINRLGGIVRIATELMTDISADAVSSVIANDLTSSGEGKIVFAINPLGNTRAPITNWLKQIKKTLVSQNRSVRFLPANNDVTAAAVEYNNLLKKGGEYLVAEGKNHLYSVAKTLVFQPYADWSERDFGRPGRDDVSGMLPPKLARIMLNLSGIRKDGVLLDPFCGSGTVLTEAALTGISNLIGSDNSPRAIKDTEQNMAWTINTYNLASPHVNVFEHDVRTLENVLPPHSIDAIVAEPYMGKPKTGRESDEEIKKEAAELQELYLSAFKTFEKLLKKDGKIVFIFPRLQLVAQSLSTALETELGTLGFVPDYFPCGKYLLYSRVGQKVQREIWRFKRR